MSSTAAQSKSPSVPLPPLAPGVPFMGNITQLSRVGMINFVESRWRELGDIFRLQLGSKTMVVLAHPDAVERVLSSHRDNYVKGSTYDGMRLLTGEGLLTLEGRPWLKRRRLEQPAFHRESIRKFSAAMSSVTENTLTRWRARMPQGGVIDAHREMMALTLEVVGETLFGQSLGEANTDVSARAFSDALELISERGNSGFSLPMIIPTPANLRLRRALTTLDEITFGVIRTARSKSVVEDRPTLLAMLLEAKDADTGERLSDLELRNEVITLFLAGHETTALLLTWGFTLLGQHPDVVQRMRAEVDTVLQGRIPGADDLVRLPYLRQVVDEILRLRSPTWAVARDVVADDVLLGHRVRPGDVVMPAMYLTHRHPDFWDDPERFDPDRFSPERSQGRKPWAYYPFSQGPRACIGNIFSLVESQIILAILLQQLEFQLEPGPVPEPRARVTVRPSAPVKVKIAWRA